MLLTIRKSHVALSSDVGSDDGISARFSILEDFDFKPAQAAPARNGRATAKVYAELSDDDDDL